MNKNFEWNRVWRGWHWQLILIVVVGIGIIQAVADVWFHYSVTLSIPMAVLLTIYLVVSRTNVKRLANTLAAVVLTVLINVLMQALFPIPKAAGGVKQLAISDATMLFFGLIMGFVFLRMTMFSERKRAELDEKRTREKATTKKPQVTVRHHRWKKKPKRKKR